MGSNSDHSMPALPRFEDNEAALERLVQDHPEVTEAARSLSQHGFAIVDVGFETETLDAVEAYTLKSMGASARIHNGWARNISVRKLATDQRILTILKRLYGREPIPFQTLNFKFGTQQRTHSDTFHFNSAPERFMCGVWVALEDINADAGPLHYYPGSHRLPVLKRRDLPGAQDYNAYEDFVAETLAAKGFERKTATLKRGQAFIWSANLFHGGSKRINPNATRLSQVSHYFFEDCAYYTPQDSNDDGDAFCIREPYDFARKRFVTSNAKHLPGRASLRTKVLARLNVLLRRTPRG